MSTLTRPPAPLSSEGRAQAAPGNRRGRRRRWSIGSIAAVVGEYSAPKIIPVSSERAVTVPRCWRRRCAGARGARAQAPAAPSLRSSALIRSRQARVTLPGRSGWRHSQPAAGSRPRSASRAANKRQPHAVGATPSSTISPYMGGVTPKIDEGGSCAVIPAVQVDPVVAEVGADVVQIVHRDAGGIQTHVAVERRETPPGRGGSMLPRKRRPPEANRILRDSREGSTFRCPAGPRDQITLATDLLEQPAHRVGQVGRTLSRAAGKEEERIGLWRVGGRRQDDQVQIDARAGSRGTDPLEDRKGAAVGVGQPAIARAGTKALGDQRRRGLAHPAAARLKASQAASRAGCARIEPGWRSRQGVEAPQRLDMIAGRSGRLGKAARQAYMAAAVHAGDRDPQLGWRVRALAPGR